MQKYELTLVIDAKASAAKRKSVKEFVGKNVELLKGKSGTVIEWGEKELAKKLGSAEKGFFLHFPIEFTPESAKKFLEKIKSENDIIRFLLVRV